MNTTATDTPALTDVAQPRKALPALVKQPHGGALYSGGVRGNKGGRPPSVLRDALRRDLGALLPMLKRIANGRAPRKGESPAMMSDRLKAIEIITRYGLGMVTELSFEKTQERLQRTLQAITRALPPEQADPLLAELRRIWTD